VDQVDIKNIKKNTLRSQVALILQEPFLFAKSIKDNISISAPSAELDQVHDAAHTSAIHEGIMTFDKGYETLVGEKGVSLSGGQKQRMAIARKIITEAPVLIFDDSLSAVDTETDRIIRDRLNKRNGSQTTLIISHRLSTLMEADRIMVLENGKIEHIGTHDELLQSCELYKRIADIQIQVR
jgi:ATP-binding cassette subfamily B protein